MPALRMSRNIPLFIAFRLLFNARFYYPIFAVIQLDYGLTMEQFAILNAVWAVSIVVLEVPSGALADRIGRKRMVMMASVLMVAEMAVLAFVPLGNTTLVFWAWVLNRILSGAAEASASGADEALAYDSISHDEQKIPWPKVLARLMRLSSQAFVIAMLVGHSRRGPLDPASAAGLRNHPRGAGARQRPAAFHHHGFGISAWSTAAFSVDSRMALMKPRLIARACSGCRVCSSR